MVFVTLEVARVLVFDCVEKHLDFELNKVKFTFVAMHCKFEVFFSEDVGGDLSHV